MSDELRKKVELVEEPAIEESKTRLGKVTNCKFLNVRRRAISDAKIVSVLKENDEVEIVREINGFYQILMDEGRIGFCMSKYIEVK